MSHKEADRRVRSDKGESLSPPPLIVPFSRKRIVLLLGGAILFVVVGFWLLSTADEQARQPPTLLKVVGISGIVFFGLCAVYSLFKLFDRKPALVILDNGFYDNSSAIAGDIIPWDTVTEIGITTIASQRFLMIKVEDPEEIIQKFNVLKRWWMRLNHKAYGTPLQISSNALKVDFEELVSIMQEKYRAYLRTVGQHTEEELEPIRRDPPQEPSVTPLSVYIDTNVLKFSATQLFRLTEKKPDLDSKGRIRGFTCYEIVNPNDRIPNEELKSEAELLQKLAELGKAGKIRYLINHETRFESWGLPNMDSETGVFYGAPLDTAKAPIKYSRAMFGTGVGDPGEAQYEFLCAIREKRFLELQRMTGAYQGEEKLNRNQLLDAFHLWCAEYNSCDFFLTLDFKLIRVLRRSKKSISVQAVRPSELLHKCTNDA